MRAPDTIDHDLLKSLGTRIKVLRISSGVKQAAFAETAGFDRNYWGRV